MTLAYDKAAERESPYGSPVSTIEWSFTTDGAGDATEETVLIWGQVKRVVTNPDGTDTPTAAWGLTIEDEDGVDILCGNGANRDADGSGGSEQTFPCPVNLAVASKLTFKVTNGGDTKKGVVKLYIV